MVEEMIHDASESLSDPDPDCATRLAMKDQEIDQFEIRLEESCLKILALHQPVATDLRRIAAVLKITAELERVADLVVHIAERTSSLVWESSTVIPNKLKKMIRLATEMLHQAIDSYVELDSDMARQVCERDDEVDVLNIELIEDLKDRMKESPDQIDPLLHLFSATRIIERLADHATNIAEDVVYLVDGDIIRHQKKLNSNPE